MAQSPAAGVVSTLTATASSASASALPTLPAVTVPPGDKGWSQAMGARILWMVGRDLQAASVNIKPPNLGPLHIQISIQNEQATVNFTAQHGVVKEALEAAVPRLREMLAENNIQLVNVDVNQRGEGGRGEAADPYQERREADQGRFGHADGVEESETDEHLRYYRSDRLLDDYA
jgi:flagellar hook-length control protein FliK